MQLFRLLQLVAEYLLYVQETLHRRNVSLEGALGEAQGQLRDQAEYIGLLEAQLRSKASIGGGGGGGGTAPGLEMVAQCDVCRKAFATDAYLQAHIRRRHPGHAQPSRPGAITIAPPASGASTCNSHR